MGFQSSFDYAGVASARTPFGFFIIIAAILAISTVARAQAVEQETHYHRVEIAGHGGIQFGGSVELSDGDVSLKAGPTVGGMLGIRVRPNAVALAGYHYQFSEAEFDSHTNGLPSSSFGLGIGYLQFGGEVEFGNHRRIKPLMGITIGAVHFTPEAESGDTDWFFAGVLFGGVKFPLAKRFGLRLDMKLLVTIFDNDSTSLCVSGQGCYSDIDVNAMAQGEALGSAYLAF